MTFDMDWSHSFCLTCDRQTDGNVYCSEACRLAEYEDTLSSNGSTPSSPTYPQFNNSFSWSIPQSQSSHSSAFLPLPSPQSAYGSYPNKTGPCKLHTQSSQSSQSPQTPQSPQSPHPYVNHSTTLTTTPANTTWDMSQLSEESKRALRGYANSFDQSRYCRRQSGA